MIIKDNSVFVDIVLNGKKFSHLSFRETEELLSNYKNKYNTLTNKEMISIPNCYAYFSNDINNNQFTCKIYKTSSGTDRWIMLMMDENEGYALYENPTDHEYELAWYHSNLDKPLTEIEEEKVRRCYNPHNYK